MTADPSAWSDILKVLGAIVGAISGQTFMSWRKSNQVEERLYRAEERLHHIEQAFAGYTGVTIEGINYRLRKGEH